MLSRMTAAAPAVTVSFLTLAFAQLWHVFNMQAPGAALLRNTIVRNPYVWGALGLCTGLLLAAIYLPRLAAVLRLVAPGTAGWLLVLAMSVIPVLLGPALRRSGGTGHRRMTRENAPRFDGMGIALSGAYHNTHRREWYAFTVQRRPQNLDGATVRLAHLHVSAHAAGRCGDAAESHSL
jgi:hypothetical protein